MKDRAMHLSNFEARLQYDVMGIGLSVWAKAGKNGLFDVIDRALEDCDVNALSQIHCAFHQLPADAQSSLLQGQRDQQTVDAALAALENNLLGLQRVLQDRPA